MNLPENIDNTNIENDDNLALEFIGKIQEIDNTYKRNLSGYKEGIYQFNLKIQNLKSKILEAQKTCSEDLTIVAALENNLTYETHSFEKLEAKFTQKIESLYELQNEYKKSIEENQYETMILQKEQEISELIYEIEEQEEVLLKIELERINRVNLLLPKQKKIKSLEVSLEKLELEKAHFESTTLEHQNLLAKSNDVSEAIEIEVLEKGD